MKNSLGLFGLAVLYSNSDTLPEEVLDRIIHQVSFVDGALFDVGVKGILSKVFVETTLRVYP